MTNHHDDADTVWVYAFRRRGDQSLAAISHNLKATLPAIERLGARHLPLTAERVDATEIDHDGTWRRVASGWVDLH